MTKLWNMVNNASSHADIAKAEKAIREANINSDDFDELMMALTYTSRELYAEERKN